MLGAMIITHSQRTITLLVALLVLAAAFASNAAPADAAAFQIL